MKYVLLIGDDQIQPRNIENVFKKPIARNLSSILTDWRNILRVSGVSSQEILPSFVEQLIWTLASDARILPLHTAMSSQEISVDIDSCGLKSLLTMAEFRQGRKLGTALGNLCEQWERYSFTALILDIVWSIENGVPEVIESIVNASDDGTAAAELNKCKENPSEYITGGLQWIAQSTPTIPVIIATQHDSEQSRRLTTACTKVLGTAFAFRKQDVTHHPQKMLKQLIGACLVACRRNAAGLQPRPHPLPSMLESTQEGIESLCGKTVADILLVSSENAEFVQELLEEFFPPVITPWLVIRSHDDLKPTYWSLSPEVTLFFPAETTCQLWNSPALIQLLRFASWQNRFTPFAKRVHLIFHCPRQFLSQRRLPPFLQRGLGDAGLHTMPEIDWISLDWDDTGMQTVVESFVKEKWAPAFYRTLSWPNSETIPQDLEAQLSVSERVMDVVTSFDGIRIFKDCLFDFLRNPEGRFEDRLPLTWKEMINQWADGKEELFQTRALFQLPRILQSCYQIAQQQVESAQSAAESAQRAAMTYQKTAGEDAGQILAEQERGYDNHVDDLILLLAPLKHLRRERNFTLWTPPNRDSILKQKLDRYLGGIIDPGHSISSRAARLLLEFYALYGPAKQFEWERLYQALNAECIPLHSLEDLIEASQPDLNKPLTGQDKTYIKHILAYGNRLPKGKKLPDELHAIKLFENTSIRWDAVAALLSHNLVNVNHSPLLLPFLLYRAQDAQTDERKLVYVYLAYLLDPFCVRVIAELLDILQRLRQYAIYERVLEVALERYNNGEMWFTCEEDFLRLGVPHFLRFLANHADREMRYPVEVNFEPILKSLSEEIVKNPRLMAKIKEKVNHQESINNARLPWKIIFSVITSYEDIRPVKGLEIPSEFSERDSRFGYEQEEEE